jgi:acetyltransferase-like isoleucine patch superfamily enzyme
MKKNIKYVIRLFGVLGAWVMPPVFLKALRSFRDSFYTGYISRRFGHLGDSSFIWKPLNIMGEHYMTIGDGNVFEAGLQLTARQIGDRPPVLSIGNHCLFRHGCHITATNSVKIGNCLLTGTNVLITDNAHGMTTLSNLQLPPRQREVFSKGGVVIGDNVWLGNNVCVMPGVVIGDGVVVGSNSVVTHDIPSFSMAAGIPAKVIKCLNPE